MARGRIKGVTEDAEFVQIEFADPNPKLGEDRWKDLAWQTLKRVPIGSLTPDGEDHLVELAKGEDQRGRAFQVRSGKVVNEVEYLSKPSPLDYANQSPFSAGKIKAQWFVAERASRIDLAAHLYDPDGRPAKIELVPNGSPFYRQPLPTWAALQGTVLVVDSSVARAETTIAVRLADEKGETAVLDVTVGVLEPQAPDQPTAFVYLPD